MRGLDAYITTQPESEQDALTPEDDGCHDCGEAPCSCDERCGGCGKRFAYANEQKLGLCGPCACDAVEAQRDEVEG